MGTGGARGGVGDEFTVLEIPKRPRLFGPTPPATDGCHLVEGGPIRNASSAACTMTRATPAPSGWLRVPPNCCPCLTSTLSSRCRKNSPGSCFRTSAYSTICSSVPTLPHCSKWHAIQSIWAPTSDCSAFWYTWGQNLQHHPHVHCVVPPGGLAHATPRCACSASPTNRGASPSRHRNTPARHRSRNTRLSLARFVGRNTLPSPPAGIEIP